MIKVIDAVMGTGKTEWAMAEIQKNPGDGPYVIVTPLLTEVERYHTAIPGSVSLSEGERKLERCKEALLAGKTVILTHSLFQNFDDECFEYAVEGGYSLYMDETVSLISEAHITPSDYKALRGTWLTEVDTIKKGIIKAVPVAHISEYEGKHSWFLKQVKTGHVFILKNRDGEDKVVLLVVPPEKLECFDKVTILTYLFLGSDSVPFLKLYDVPYEHLALHRHPDSTPENKQWLPLEAHSGDYSGVNYEAILNVYQGKHNAIGERANKRAKYPLSFGWYRMVSKFGIDTSREKGIGRLSSSLRAFFRGLSHDDILWTCPKAKYKQLRHHHFDHLNSSSWLAVNTRATNDYKDRHHVAICQDLYPRMPIQAFFKDRGLEIDEDAHALSMMIQFIWRSAIRKGEPINVYVPSKRMRNLLKTWLRGQYSVEAGGFRKAA